MWVRTGMCDTAACREESGTERTEHTSANRAAVPTPPSTLDDGPWLSTVNVDRDCPPREAARSSAVHRPSAPMRRMYTLMREAQPTGVLRDIDLMPHWSSRRERTAPTVASPSSSLPWCHPSSYLIFLLMFVPGENRVWAFWGGCASARM